MKLAIKTAIVLSIFWACTVEPQPIEYGVDQCDYCRMTIVDNQHAAEAVSRKGKAYKFDAIECMVNYLADYPDKEYAFLLVGNVLEPGELIDAQESQFLISENLPSPMGAFLSAVPDSDQLQVLMDSVGGKAYDWPSLLDHMNQ